MGKLSEDTARARRLAAELSLVNNVHGLVTHELGNPLQSLVVLVELTRDELEARSPLDPGVKRLSRALDSVERFRTVLVNSGRVRAALFELDEEERAGRRWGSTLDVLLPIVAHRLSRVAFRRCTASVDERRICPAFPTTALLAMLVGLGEWVRRARSRGLVVELDGRVIDGLVRLRLSASGEGVELGLDAELVEEIGDLLSEAVGCGCRLEDGALTMWAPQV